MSVLKIIQINMQIKVQNKTILDYIIQKVLELSKIIKVIRILSKFKTIIKEIKVQYLIIIFNFNDSFNYIKIYKIY